MIILCFSVIVGATFALFSSESKSNIAITSGKVDVVASLSHLKTYTNGVEQSDGNFELGGKATLEDGSLILENIAPMDCVEFDIDLENNSTVAIKYQLQMMIEDETSKPLFEALKISTTIKDETLKMIHNGLTKVSTWSDVKEKNAYLDSIHMKIELPMEATSEVAGKKTNITIVLYAVQANSHVEDPVEDIESDLNKIYLYNLIDLKEFRDSVNQKGENYRGKTVYLMNDINLENEEWKPIQEFKGTFNGQNHTISNLKITKKEDNSGFFALTTDLIENLTIHNATIYGGCSVGVISGNAFTGKISHCHVTGKITLEGNYQVGGIAGGQCYAQFDSCSVIGDKGSSIKGIYKEKNKEGDAIGGIVSYTAETTSHERVKDCTVEYVDIEGTRKVGGIAGQVGTGNGVLRSTYSYGTISSNATDTYVNQEAGKIFVGGIIGEAICSVDQSGYGKTVLKENTVHDAKIMQKEKHIYDAFLMEILGGTRGSIGLIDDQGGHQVYDCHIYLYGLELNNESWIIQNEEELFAFSYLVNNGYSFQNEKVCLKKDIDLKNEPWTPIGKTSFSFKGSFDGEHHTISNLFIDGKSLQIRSGLGFFGSIESTKIENFTLKNVHIEPNDTYKDDEDGGYFSFGVGGVAGYAKNVTIDHVNLYGNLHILGFQYVGGLVGNGYATITHCTITQTSGMGIASNCMYVGGLIGFHGEGSSMISYNTLNHVKVLETTSYQPQTPANYPLQGAIGGITGIAHYQNIIEHNILNDVQIIIDGAVTTNPDTPGKRVYQNHVGALAGTYTYQGINEKSLPIIQNNQVQATVIYPNSRIFHMGLVGDVLTIPSEQKLRNLPSIDQNTVLIDWNNIKITGKHTCEIDSKEGLLALSQYPRDRKTPDFFQIAEGGVVHVFLNEDVDLENIEWTPIDGQFLEFDGKGHTISNLFVSDGYFSGFFGYAGGSHLQNLTLENVRVSGCQVGAFAGQSEGATFENLTLKGTVDITWTNKDITDQKESGTGIITGVWVEGNIVSIYIDCMCDITIHESEDLETKFLEYADKNHYTGRLFLGYDKPDVTGIYDERKQEE